MGLKGTVSKRLSAPYRSGGRGIGHLRGRQMKEAAVLANRGFSLMATRRCASGTSPRRNGFPNPSVNPKPLELGDTSCPSGVGVWIARLYIDSQSGGDDSVEVCPLRINEKAPAKSRGCQYPADLCVHALNGRWFLARLLRWECAPDHRRRRNNASVAATRHIASGNESA
jgi:hypothetical protein